MASPSEVVLLSFRSGSAAVFAGVVGFALAAGSSPSTSRETCATALPAACRDFYRRHSCRRLDLHHSVESPNFLIACGVVGLGIDTLSIDYGASKNFELHRVDLPKGLYNLENLANLDQLPPTGAFLIAAPIKLDGGSGGPVRAFAIMP